jgi:Methyltransferase FkbM domain
VPALSIYQLFATILLVLAAGGGFWNKSMQLLRVSHCKHFYFDLGTNNALSIGDFITYEGEGGPISSAYRKEQSLALSDFCVFGFEPNPVHSRAHQDVTAKYRHLVKYLKIFSETVAGTTEGTTKLLVDQYDGEYPAWGSSIMSNHVIMRNQNNTRVAEVRSLDFSQFLKKIVDVRDSDSKVIIRMDIEGSEFVLLRGLVASGLLCLGTDKLIIEWHPDAVEPSGWCLRAAFEWLLSSSTCKVDVSYEGAQLGTPHQPVCNGWLLSDQVQIDE